MDLSNLRSAEDSVHREGKHVGRGQGSGKGRTSTCGYKDTKSRPDFSHKVGFEGGQMPLQRHVPKFDFENSNHKEYVGINLSKLQELVGAGRIAGRVDAEALVQSYVVKRSDLVKISGGSELKTELKISIRKLTISAKAAIEIVGGEIVTL